MHRGEGRKRVGVEREPTDSSLPKFRLDERTNLPIYYIIPLWFLEISIF